MFKKTILIALFLTVALLLSTPVLVQGQGIVPPDHGNCPNNYQGNCGNYTVDDFIVLAVKISDWILGIVGSLTLLMFIYGGFMFLISAGSSDKIGEARKIIVAAVVGLLIVLASFLIIKFVLSSMGLSWNGGQSVTIIPENNSTYVPKPDTCAADYPGYSCMDNTGKTGCIKNECLSVESTTWQCCPN